MNVGKQVFNDCGTLLGQPQLTQALNTAAVYMQPSRVGQPRTEAFCDGRGLWLKQVKASGATGLPWGFRAAVTYQNLPGIPQRALMSASSAQVAAYLGRTPSSGGTTLIDLLEPNTYFEDRITQVDVRTSRVFRIGRSRIEAMLDIYNAFNSNSILSINTAYGSSWLRPTEVLAGRLLKFGAQWQF